MTDLVQRVTTAKHNFNENPSFKSGDTVEVHVKVKEGEKERIQKFKGIVTKVAGDGMGKSFTVRKISSGVGVERTFPFSSPNVAKIDVLAKGIVRQSRLYYLRDLHGKKARIKSTLVSPTKA